MKMSMLNRVLLAAGISWVCAVTLRLLFAARASGRFSLNTLTLPGVIPVALIVSTVAALLMTPIAVWSVRTGVKNLSVYVPILWVVLAAYIVLVIPRTGAHGPYGLFLQGIAGAVILGFIPAAK
jgi:hypothetical protein